MIQSGKDVECNYLFIFMYRYIYPLIEIFYNIKIIGKENLKSNKEAIYIFKHTTHNYDIIPGLFMLYKELKKPVRGLGHFLIYFFCPHYIKLGIVVGDRYNVEKLLENKESIAVIPGGAEEMASSLTEPNKLNWISKSGNYKTGFAKLSIKYDVDIIPMAAKNAEYMAFSPWLYLINKTDILTNYNTLMNKSENSRNVYIVLYYIKLFFTLIFASLLVIPIPTPVTFIIGEPVKKIKDEDVIEYTKRCEFELQNLVCKASNI